MAELRRAEKLASAKKRLQQFQQKNKDSQGDSGRSTPSKKKLEEADVGGGIFQSGNGGSTLSLCHSENMSSNISGTESPVLASDSSMDNLCQVLDGGGQPDPLNAFNSLPKVSGNLFQSPSPLSWFAEMPPLASGQSGSEFFDNLSSGNDPPDPEPQAADSSGVVEAVLLPLLNVAVYHPQVNASTPEGPLQDTPNYSFPDASFSPINKPARNDITEESVNNSVDLKLKNSWARNAELEQQVAEQKCQIIQLQSHLEDMKKRADEEVSTLKHHVQVIDILVSEKTELQTILDKRQEQVQSKTGELDECQGRLRASRHRVTDLERELSTIKSHVQLLETSLRDTASQRAQMLDQSVSMGKRVGDLELEVSDLQSKLENGNEALRLMRAAMDQKNSQLSLAEVKIQQLSGGAGSDGRMEEELRQKNEDLSKRVLDLENQLSSELAAKDESMKEYRGYVSRLQVELEELRSALSVESERVLQLTQREVQLMGEVSGLERQLRVASAPALQTDHENMSSMLRTQLARVEDRVTQIQAQLDGKVSELITLREGLLERGLRIQELEAAVERLESEQPDSASLQAAIESDKVAASRAVAQNNDLKKQLEELQEAVVKLSNDKLDLTQRLQHEQHLSGDLRQQLERVQESKSVEADKAEQTETPLLRECEAQTSNSPAVVSPEVMSKLEEKFRKTMSELADLSDEKQRLEHLVLQLQGETETIGEYITLYQIQRGMLRQRAQEKDEQVARLAQDKENLRNKLGQLNCLVQRLVGSGHAAVPHLNGYESEAVTEDEEKKQNATSVTPPPLESTTNLETAERIRSLLSEIGSNNLVTSATENTNINFHPCPWCSGRLITV